MLSKEIFVEGIQRLVNFYPQWAVKVEDLTVMEMWYEEFEDCNDKDFKTMIKEYIGKERFSPTVAAMKTHYKNTDFKELEIIYVER